MLFVVAVPICFAVDVMVCRLMWSTLAGYLGHFFQMSIFFQLSEGRGFFVVTAGAGLLTGQSVLVAYWLTQGSEVLSHRLLTAVALLALLLFSWFLGGALTDNYPPYQVSLLITAFCLTLFSVVAAALWISGLVTQGRITAADTAHEQRSRGQFSLSYLLVAIAVIAIFLALAKAIFGVQTVYVRLLHADFLGVFAKGVLVGSYVILIVLPLAPMVLGKERRKSKLMFAVAALALFPLLSYEAFIAFHNISQSWRYIWRPSSGMYARVIGTAFAFGFAVFLVTISGLCIMRTCGYRLRSKKVRKEPDQATFVTHS